MEKNVHGGKISREKMQRAYGKEINTPMNVFKND